MNMKYTALFLSKYANRAAMMGEEGGFFVTHPVLLPGLTKALGDIANDNAEPTE